MKHTIALRNVRRRAGHNVLYVHFYFNSRRLVSRCIRSPCGVTSWNGSRFRCLLQGFVSGLRLVDADHVLVTHTHDADRSVQLPQQAVRLARVRLGTCTTVSLHVPVLKLLPSTGTASGQRASACAPCMSAHA